MATFTLLITACEAAEVSEFDRLDTDILIVERRGPSPS